MRGECFDNFCRNATNQCVVGHVLSDDGTCCYHTVTTNGDARQYDGIGTNPDIVANDNWICANSLFVNAFCGVFEVVVQCGHCDALCKIDVVANADGTNDGTVYSDARVVANSNIAHGVVDAAVRLDDATLAQPETTIGWRVHASAPVDF